MPVGVIRRPTKQGCTPVEHAWHPLAQSRTCRTKANARDTSPMHASKVCGLRSSWAARYCPKVGTATKQPGMFHELQGISRSLLLEGNVRLNTIKNPNQLALHCAAAPTPRSQPQGALHALRRARLRSSGPWTARSSQPKAASDGDDLQLRDTLFSLSGRVGHRATLLRHGKPLCPR
jgi:hypothetical protein